MELLQKHLESLIVQRALTLFFYNFNTYPEILEEMKAENGGFANEWEKLQNAAQEKAKKTGWMATIEYTDIYGLFATKLTYKAQALLIEKVMKHYGEEAKKNIDFSIQCDIDMQEHMKRTRKEAEVKQKQIDQIIKNSKPST